MVIFSFCVWLILMLSSFVCELTQFQEMLIRRAYLSTLLDQQGQLLTFDTILEGTHEEVRAFLLGQDPCVVTLDSKINTSIRRAYVDFGCRHAFVDQITTTRANTEFRKNHIHTEFRKKKLNLTVLC